MCSSLLIFISYWLALRRFAVKYHIIRFLFVIIVVCMRYTIALTFSPATVIEATSAKISICQQSEFVDHGSDFFPKPSKFLLGNSSGMKTLALTVNVKIKYQCKNIRVR